MQPLSAHLPSADLLRQPQIAVQSGTPDQLLPGDVVARVLRSQGCLYASVAESPGIAELDTVDARPVDVGWRPAGDQVANAIVEVHGVKSLCARREAQSCFQVARAFRSQRRIASAEAGIRVIQLVERGRPERRTVA